MPDAGVAISRHEEVLVNLRVFDRTLSAEFVKINQRKTQKFGEGNFINYGIAGPVSGPEVFLHVFFLVLHICLKSHSVWWITLILSAARGLLFSIPLPLAMFKTKNKL